MTTPSPKQIIILSGIILASAAAGAGIAAYNVQPQSCPAASENSVCNTESMSVETQKDAPDEEFAFRREVDPAGGTPLKPESERALYYRTKDGVYRVNTDISATNRALDADEIPQAMQELPLPANPEGLTEISRQNAPEQQAIFYTTYPREFSSGDSGGILWRYDTSSQAHEELYVFDDLGLYASPRIEGWNSEYGYLVIDGVGGDAGAIWGEVYRWRADTKTLETVPFREHVNEGIEGDFLRSPVSKDGRYRMYSLCPRSMIFPEQPELYAQTCPDGDRLAVYDIAHDTVFEVFKHNPHPNNTNQAVLGALYDSAWMDGAPHSFMTVGVDGLYRIDIDDKQVTHVYEFNTMNPKEFLNMTPSIGYASGRYVLLDYYYPLRRHELIDLETKRGLIDFDAFGAVEEMVGI